MLVIGKKLKRFVDRETGKIVSYARIYVTYDFSAEDSEDAELDGTCGEEIKVPVDVISKVSVGDEIQPVYNKKGRVEDIDIL